MVASSISDARVGAGVGRGVGVGVGGTGVGVGTAVGVSVGRGEGVDVGGTGVSVAVGNPTGAGDLSCGVSLQAPRTVMMNGAASAASNRTPKDGITCLLETQTTLSVTSLASVQFQASHQRLTAL